MSRLRRAAVRLAKLRARAFAHAGLAAWEFDVLAALRRAGTELTATQLVTATMIGSAAMTTRLDKLTDRGLVVRRPNPDDGRGILVAITTDGEARVDAAMTELVRAEASALSRPVSAADQAKLASILRLLVDGERDRRDQPPAPGRPFLDLVRQAVELTLVRCLSPGPSP